VKRTTLVRRTALKNDPERVREFQERGRRSSAKRMSKPRPVSPASIPQRVKCRWAVCIVCQDPSKVTQPAHLIDRSLCPEGADDPRAVVPLCAAEHHAYDLHELDLLPYLEPHYRTELAFAVERFGLVSTYKRVTGDWDVRISERED
jgi:hypothetical protein